MRRRYDVACRVGMLERLLLTLEGSQETSTQVWFFKHKMIFFALILVKVSFCHQLYSICFVLYKIPKFYSECVTALNLLTENLIFTFFSDT